MRDLQANESATWRDPRFPEATPRPALRWIRVSVARVHFAGGGLGINQLFLRSFALAAAEGFKMEAGMKTADGQLMGSLRILPDLGIYCLGPVSS